MSSVGKKSKTKGSRFERDICRRLSLFFSRGKKEDLFWRSSMSGGRATIATKKGRKALTNQSGDICAIDPLGHQFCDRYFVECKNYKDFGGSIMYGGSLLSSFWLKCLSSAADHNKIPLMVVKESRRPELLIGPYGWNPFAIVLPICQIPMGGMGMNIFVLESVLAINPDSFFTVGSKDETISHGGLASRRPTKKRLSLGLSD